MGGKWVPERPGGAERGLGGGALFLMGKRVPDFVELGPGAGRQG